MGDQETHSSYRTEGIDSARSASETGISESAANQPGYINADGLTETSRGRVVREADHEQPSAVAQNCFEYIAAQPFKADASRLALRLAASNVRHPQLLPDCARFAFLRLTWELSSSGTLHCSVDD